MLKRCIKTTFIVFMCVVIALIGSVPSSAVSGTIIAAVTIIGVLIASGLFSGSVSELYHTAYSLAQDTYINQLANSYHRDNNVVFFALIVSAIKDRLGFTDENVEIADEVEAGTFVPQDSTYELYEVDLNNVDWSLIDENCLLTTLDFAVGQPSDGFTWYSNYGSHNPDFVGPYAYPQVNFGIDGFDYSCTVNPIYGGIKCQYKYYYNGNEYLCGENRFSDTSYSYMQQIFIYKPVKYYNTNKNWYQFYQPVGIRGPNNRIAHSFTEIVTINGNSVTTDYNRINCNGQVLSTRFNSGSAYFYDLFFGDGVEVTTPSEPAIVYDADTNSYVNQDGITWQPDLDYSLISDAVREGVEGATITLPSSDIVENTYNDYIDQHIENNIQNVVYDYPEPVIQREFEQIHDDVVIETPVDSTNENAGFFDRILDFLQRIKNGITSIKDWLVMIWSKITGISDDTAAISDAVTDTASEQTVQTMSLPQLIVSKFPFCIPWDVYRCFAEIAVEPVAPSYSVDIPVPFMDITVPFSFDFEAFSFPAKITRYFFALMFVLMLIIATKKIIWS